MSKNKGYTLVELIIVIAIMAVLSGISFVTIGIIKTAKRSTAVNTLSNQIGSCLIRTKATSGVANGVSTSVSSSVPGSLCMVIEKRNNGTYAIMTGYYNGTDVVGSSGDPLDKEKKEDCDAILPKEVEAIKYTSSDSSQEASFATADKLVIQFVKSDGSVQYGAGEYALDGGSGTGVYATIVLNPVTGKHYIK